MDIHSLIINPTNPIKDDSIIQKDEEFLFKLTDFFYSREKEIISKLKKTDPYKETKFFIATFRMIDINQGFQKKNVKK